MKKYLEKILFILAKLIIARYKPIIIGITGSVGKTSTKDAIYSVLNNKFKVRKNIKNYNNEIGLPITIIGCKTYGKNIIAWLLVFIKAIIILIYWPYPKILILEMGADKPGDIKYLTKLAPCNIGILTAMGSHPVHAEFFKNIDHLVKEKSNIISHLNTSDTAIINIDEPLFKNVSENTKAEVMTVGTNEKAVLQVSDINYTTDIEHEESIGINFKVNYQGNSVPFKIPNILGTPQVYAVLNAVAVGLTLKMNLVEISEIVRNYKPPKGRMNLLPGIKETFIIDDSYNSSPVACQRALEVLSSIQVSGRKIACLGNMEELGENSKRAHRDIGRLVKELEIDILFTMGDKAKDIAEAAMEKGMQKDSIFIFKNSDEARKAVQDEMHRGDIILIKGSQSARCEKITKEIMAEPSLAKDLLVRQEKFWLKK